MKGRRRETREMETKNKTKKDEGGKEKDERDRKKDEEETRGDYHETIWTSSSSKLSATSMPKQRNDNV